MVRGRFRTQAPGALGGHRPAAVRALLQPGGGGQRQHLGARRLRQAQVVLHQRVLGADAASGHTGAALGTAGALGADAAEVGVGRLLARRPEEHPDRGGVKGLADAHLLGHRLHHDVGGGVAGIGDHPEHPLGLLVVRAELIPPVSDVRPLLVGEERFHRLVQRVGVDQRTATHAGAGENQHVPQLVDALNTKAAELGRPEKAPQVPGRLAELVVGETATGFQDTDPVALLGESQGGNAPAEPRTDDQDVVVSVCHVPPAYLCVPSPWGRQYV